jgi:hypothetical protein
MLVDQLQNAGTEMLTPIADRVVLKADKDVRPGPEDHRKVVVI